MGGAGGGGGGAGAGKDNDLVLEMSLIKGGGKGREDEELGKWGREPELGKVDKEELGKCMEEPGRRGMAPAKGVEGELPLFGEVKGEELAD